jgi:hypothetical protein
VTGTLASGTARRCVYTSLTGGYERLVEQRMAARSTIPFICFTDDPHLKSESWQIRVVEPLFGSDPSRSQRDIKIRPHRHLTEFDASIYIDNSVIMDAPAEEIFERYATDRGIAVPLHSFRETVLDEFNAVARHQLDDQTRIYEQLNHYALESPHVLEQKPHWCGVMLRDHTSDAVQTFGEIWAAHVYRYSRRDQLSFNYALDRAGVIPLNIEINNHKSWFHRWMADTGRDLDANKREASRSLQPLVARVRALELELRKKTEHVDELTTLIDKLQRTNLPPTGATPPP